MDPATVSIILTTVGWLAKPIFKKVVDVAWQQFTERKGLRVETDDLIAELKSFKVPVETTETEEYLKDVKELVNEAKDLLDELDYFRLQEEVIQMNKAKQGNIFPKKKSSDASSSSEAGNFKELKFDKKGMSNRMKDLTKKLKLTCESLNPRLQHQLLSSIFQSMQNVNNPVVQVDRQITAALPLEDKIYGRDGEIGQIKTLINNAEQHPHKIPVIAIVGNGGTGKTTLAQRVYNHPTVNFDKKIWICVPTNFNEMGLTRQMLECCSDDGRKCDGENLTHLKSILISKLKDKKVLLVLDDIWEIKSKREWDSLLSPLKPSNGTMVGSVVLVTTRFSSIAKNVEAIEPTINLDGLDESSAWSFFKNCVFGNDQCDVPDILENIGKHIVNRLRGYPLAIKTVGALLKSDIDVVHWKKILESEQWKFLDGKDDIMPTLRLSYEYLPVHLQQCFSYCSLFPQDHYFEAEELIYMWLAQDFINANGERVEDVALGYLNELVERAFFQKVCITKNEKYLIHAKYVIHDLMHQLAQVVSSKEILAINHSEHTSIPSSLYHLSFLLDVNYTIESCVQFQNLRSLLIFENVEDLEDTLNWDQANRIRLRLLIVPYIRSFSYNFSHFTHLRYLKLTSPFFNDKTNKFPVQICRLYHLQVLELEDPNNFIQELPKTFNNLVNLRHFIANNDLHSEISGVGKLKYLQELEKFVVRGEKGFELGQLSELKELRGSLEICSLQNVTSREEAKHIRLSEKEIVDLKLFWDKKKDDEPRQKRGSKGKWGMWVKRKGRECRTTDASSEEILDALRPNSGLRYLMIDQYGGCNSPSWLTDHSLEKLESIYLSKCNAWDKLPNFGQLMCLKKLYLRYLPKVRAFRPQFHGCGPQEGFPFLKKMIVGDMDALESWVWSQQHTVFPSLKKLCVSRCSNLKDFSFLNLVSVHQENTKWFPQLKHLTIEHCPKLQEVVPPNIIPFIYTRGIIETEIDGGFGSIKYSRSRDDLEIQHVKDPRVLAFILGTFQNICSMKISECSNLKSLSWKCICMVNSLKRLTFKRCRELNFSLIVEEKYDGSTFYSHELLQELEIIECGVTGEELSYLLAHLPTISKLSIKKCHGIDYVSLSGIIDEPKRDSSEARVEIDQDHKRCPGSLACLEELYIDDCPGMVIVNDGDLSGLTALKKIEVHGSEEFLYSMIQTEGSNYVHTLIIEENNITLLNLHRFVELKKLVLRDCEYLAAVEGPHSPTSPKVIIRNCPLLATMPSDVEPKFSMPVRKLRIDSMEFILFHANRFLMYLRSLTISVIWLVGNDGSELKWEKWTEEQENALIKHLTALEKLTLYYCYHLSSLPNMFYLHPSLKELTIDECPKIKSLPQRGFPKSLEKLRLADCSEELESQCSELEDFECSNEADEHGFEYTVFLKIDPSVN